MPVFKYQHGDRPLDGYTIEHGVGRGGFGEVYYAVSDSGREVALKSVLNYEDIELRGIRQCMNLKSPHLVSIFDVRRNSRNEPFVIMEFVSGPSLRDLLDENPEGLGPAKSAFFLREMAKGITYLHDCGVVHRDMKPHNVFFEDGIVKIGDYSLSKSMSASHRSGHTVTVGTVHYMAPEISMGRYDMSVDIYALGIMLYELLTGRTPFSGDSIGEVLMKHVNGEVDLSGIDEPFAGVIKKALAKDPEDRYQTAEEMVTELFGSQNIQDSVMAFNPASLTLVAERIERKITPHRPSWDDAKDEPLPPPERDAVVERPRSFAYQPNNARSRERADEFVQAELVPTRGDGLLHHAWMAITQFAAVIGFTTKGWRDYWGPVTDPIGRIPRAIMMIPAFILAALISGGEEGVFLCFTGGAVIGSLVAILTQRVLLPRLERSSTGLYRVVMMTVYGVAAIPLGFFCLGMMPRHYHYGYGEVITSFLGWPIVSIILLDWRALTGPARRNRFSFLRTIAAMFLGGPVGLCMAISAQLGSKFDPVVSRRTCPDVPWLSHLGKAFDLSLGRLAGAPVHASKFIATSINRVAMGAPINKNEVSPSKRFWALLLSFVPFVAGLQRLYVGRIKTGLLWLATCGLMGFGQLFDIVMIALGQFRDGAGRVVSTWNTDDVTRPVGRAVNSLSNVVTDTDWSRVRTGAGNFALNFFGGIGLLLTLLLGLFLALDLPSAAASGALKGIDLHPQGIEEAWGTKNWDSLLFRLVSIVTMFVAAITVAVLMMARRQKSYLHIARVPVSGVVIMLSMLCVNSCFNGPFWTNLADSYVSSGDNPTIEHPFPDSPKPGPVIEQVLNSPIIPFSLFSMAIFAASLFILAWPDKKRSNSKQNLKSNKIDSDNVVQAGEEPVEAASA